MPSPRFAVRSLLAPPADGAGRRIAIAGIAGMLLTAPLSMQQAVAPYPVLSWLLTGCGAVIAVASLRVSWSPRAAVTRGALGLLVVFCAVSGVLGISQTISSLRQSDQQLICRDDVAPDTVVGGQEVLSGADPYTSFNLLTAERALGCASYSVTPLGSGIFAYFTSPPTAPRRRHCREAPPEVCSSASTTRPGRHCSVSSVRMRWFSSRLWRCCSRGLSSCCARRRPCAVQ